MKRRLSLTHIDKNCAESKRAHVVREASADASQQSAANAEWGSASCPALPVGPARTPLFSSVLADAKHQGMFQQRQSSATSVAATGSLVAPEQANKSTTPYKHTIILGGVIVVHFHQAARCHKRPGFAYRYTSNYPSILPSFVVHRSLGLCKFLHQANRGTDRRL